MNKDTTDTILDTMVYGQLFVDNLEDIGKKKSIFKQELKYWAKKTIKELRNKIDLLFSNMDSEGSYSVIKLHDINLSLLRKINSLSIEEKYALYQQFDIVCSHIDYDKVKGV